MPLSDLQSIPESVIAAHTIAQRYDACLRNGLARLSDEHREGLASLARAFTGTPLGARVEAAATGVAQGALIEHLAALAAARTALDGACYDALRHQAAAALGLPAAEEPAVKGAGAFDPASQALLESARQWLVELALSGFAQLERATVLPFGATLEEIQNRPDLTRLAAVLTSFYDELADAVPTTTMEVVPVKRWSDIWTRALMLATFPAAEPALAHANGTLTPVGVDVRIADHLISAEIWASLEEDKKARLVRTTVSTWKVDAVYGSELWGLLAANTFSLFSALADSRPIKLDGMELLSSGDLRWNAMRSSAGKGAEDPIEVARLALKEAPPILLPAERHPALLAIPVVLDDCAVKPRDKELIVESGGATLPVANARLGPLAPDFRKGKAFGLLRFDALRWTFQPITVEGKDAIGVGIASGIKGKGGTTSVLKERAGKLLRKKS